MKKCPYCGAENDESMKVCHHCFVELPHKEEEPKKEPEKTRVPKKK